MVQQNVSLYCSYRYPLLPQLKLLDLHLGAISAMHKRHVKYYSIIFLFFVFLLAWLMLIRFPVSNEFQINYLETIVHVHEPLNRVIDAVVLHIRFS